MIPMRNRKVSSEQITEAAFSNDKRFPRSSREKIELASRAIGLTPEAIKSALETAQMIDLDELERAADLLDSYADTIRRDGIARIEEHLYLPEVEELAETLRTKAPELIAMARRYQWLRDEAWNITRSAPAVCMVDSAGRPFVGLDHQYADPILEGGSLDEAIDDAMQEQKP